MTISQKVCGFVKKTRFVKLFDDFFKREFLRFHSGLFGVCSLKKNEKKNNWAAARFLWPATGMSCGKDSGGNRKVLPARLFGGLFFFLCVPAAAKKTQGNGKRNSYASGNESQIIGREAAFRRKCTKKIKFTRWNLRAN